MPENRPQKPSGCGFPAKAAQYHGQDPHRAGICLTDPEGPPDPSQIRPQKKNTVGEKHMLGPQGPQKPIEQPKGRPHRQRKAKPDRTGLGRGHPSRRLNQPPLRAFS